MKSQYPVVPLKATTEDVANILRSISRLRQEEDLPDFTGLPNKFLSGRSTTRIPSSPADVLSTDVQGDVVYATDGAYMYVLVSVTGTLTWGRMAIDTGW